MSSFLDEAQAESGFVDLVRGLGYAYAFGPEIAPDGDRPERESYSQVVLFERLRCALGRVNPEVPDSAIDDACRRVIRTDSPSLIENNRAFHGMLTDGVPVEYRADDGRVVHANLALMDWDNPAANDWLVVNQFTVVEGKQQRRPDVVLFINGLPLVVVEMKNPGDEKADLRKAYNQFQTYKGEIPSLFAFNELLVISDGLSAAAGTLTAGWSRFMPWRTIEGKVVAPAELPQLEVLVQGMLDPGRLLDLIRNFMVFEDDGQEVAKKVAAYHQYHAVNKALDCTVQAASPEGDQRAGVVWHTQGSGKSLSMVFYAGKIIQHPAMENPTLVVLTDRNDLDEQLHGTFCACEQLLRQSPVQAKSRQHLRDLLSVASGGVVFTTIQKFMPDTTGDTFPQLSERSNIVVIADEAHRSQYDFIDGFARHMRDALPNASWIGFTGTPIEQEDKSTPAVFGNYIDVYDIQRANEDGATVPIYYESRLAKLELKEEEKPRIDPEFNEVTEGEEDTTRRKLQSRWARIEALLGTENRLKLVAQDMVKHFEEREAAMPGKAMMVCMSRRICVDLYEEIVKLRPEWDSPDDDQGSVKVVMTGSASDPEHWQKHVRNKSEREALAKRFKNPDDPLKIVLVRDMWLTGFDCPVLHTMYLDKPMRGHTLMQAIARVNRVFHDKPGGLVVDYLGLANELKKALQNYTASGGGGRPTVDQEEAVAVMQEKYEIVRDMFDGFDYSGIVTGPKDQRMRGVAQAADHILGLEDGKRRYLQAVTELSKAFSLAVPHEDALKIRDEVGFFQAVRSAIAKAGGSEGEQSQEELDTAMRQIVSRAVSPEGVVDIFASAGLKNPDISVLSDEFLAEVRDLPQRNLAVEMLQKLLNDQIKTQQSKNVVQARSFAEMLEEAVRKYQNRSVESAQVIQELIDLARKMREAQSRGEELGLNEREVAFYDALADHDGVRDVMGDDTLKQIAHELVEAVQQSTTIDWTERQAARAKIQVIVKRILKRHDYPPDKQEKATQTVLEQAAALCGEIAA